MVGFGGNIATQLYIHVHSYYIHNSHIATSLFGNIATYTELLSLAVAT